ncbi:hypothetical protein [Paenibacillus sp. FSL R5-0519]|uniref:hypothetical protein n=1 Tax=Paenibacillus sp. FSL R5-0519 TaxID=2921648 RepID=UPI0030DAB045
MKKSHSLYLILSISFIVIIVISFFVGIKPEIIFGYSVATFIFAVIDFIIVLQEGKSKLNLLKKDDINNTMTGYVEVIDSFVEGALEDIKDGKKELVNTRKKFYGKLLAQQPVFNLKKKNLKKAVKPAENISEINKEIQISNNFFESITRDLRALDPSQSESRSNKLAWFFSMVGLILVLVSPFIPEQAYTFVFGREFNSIGTYLVLLSLSLIFLTSYFRHKYDEEIKELQKVQFSVMLGQFEKVKFQIGLGMKDLNEALHESSEEFGEVMELIASSLEKVIEEKQEKNKPQT